MCNNEIKYIMFQIHTDRVLEELADYVPPVIPYFPRWIDVEKVIKDIPKIKGEFYCVEMIFYAYNILLWQTTFGIITREKLTEFIDALAQNNHFAPIVEFIMSVHLNK